MYHLYELGAGVWGGAPPPPPPHTPHPPLLIEKLR
jgi:hypothetical protein